MQKKQKIERVTLYNEPGDSAVILTLGGILCELNIMTTDRKPINIVLGFSQLARYRDDSEYHGAIVGRYANRIAHSRFSIDNTVYTLEPNEGNHLLHGGSEGFHRRIWTIKEQTHNSCTLQLRSADRDQGFPGNLQVLLRYTLNNNRALDINWQATTDKDTPVGLSSHGYFNLAGQGDIYDHFLRIPIAHYTPVNDECIPTGEISKVQDTCMDLRNFSSLRAVLSCNDRMLAPFDGLDHNWARGSSGEMLLSAELLCPATNLLLQVRSTLPGIQCYTGNYLETPSGHGRHSGVCLEPQYYPNSPNEPGFPSPLLKAGETVRHWIQYRVAEVDAAAYLADL